MNFLPFIFTLSVLSTIHGQECWSRLNSSITGQCSSIDSCQGTILASSSCEQERCCVRSTSPSIPQNCITAENFNVRYNTTRGEFLRVILNYGINSAGICYNCQAKAAFLAIAATMTENFTTDEATGTDAQFAADDDKYGNSQLGDGSRFRRRGFFGLRGRAMYQQLQNKMPEYQSFSNPVSMALTLNAIQIASKLWNSPDLINGRCHQT